MNTLQDTNQTSITLDMICQQKREKLTEIRASKERISHQVRELFHPTETNNSTHSLTNSFSSGIAIFNGVMTGFKIIRRIRSFFPKRK